MTSLLAVDGTALGYRQLFGMPHLTRQDGMDVGGIIGFGNKLHSLQQRFKCTHGIVAFDSSRHTFRRHITDSYKANRTSELTESDLLQFKVMREMSAHLGFRVVMGDHYEADDYVGAYVTQFVQQSKKHTAIAVAPDKDFLQLISARISVFANVKEIDSPVIDRKAVHEKWGIAAHVAADYQAMVGDAIDAIKGGHGLGPVAAAALLQDRTSIHDILLQADSVKRDSWRNILYRNHDALLLARKLTALQTAIPLPDLDCQIKPNPQKLIALCKALEFKSLTKRYANFFKIDLNRIAPDSKWALANSNDSNVSVNTGKSIFQTKSLSGNTRT